LFASAHIICDKNLSPADKANLEEAIRLVIYDSNDPEGYHNLFGHERLQPLADFISNADQFSSLVYKMHKNYLRVAGSRSDAELEQCNVILSNRMNSFKGEGAKVGSVMFAILNGMHRNIHLIGNDKPDWL
jgi:hypothetical protein